jgi:CRP-like cAMP-binding protein
MEITTVGDIPDVLYIVTVGVVCVVMHGEQVFEAKKGDVFGENAMLALSLDVRRQRTCIAKTMCELCRLDKDDLSSLLTTDELRDPLNIMIQTHLAYLEEANIPSERAQTAFHNERSPGVLPPLFLIPMSEYI